MTNWKKAVVELARRKGRVLEKIIEDLESLLSGEQFIIKSPDWIYDQVAERKREVDLSLRGNFGTHQILIIIECRDHGRRQGTPWIEQLYQKTKDLRANAVVAISSSGFSGPAMIKAEKFGIELRTLTTFHPEEIVSWLKPPIVVFSNNLIQVMHVNYEVTDNDNIGLIEPVDSEERKTLWQDTTKGSDPMLLLANGKKMSINDFVLAVNDQNDNFLHKDILPNANPVLKSISINLYNPDQLLYIEANEIQYRIIRIDIDVNCFTIEKEIRPETGFIYQSEEKVLGGRIDYHFQITDVNKLSLSLQNDMEKNKQNLIVVYKSNPKT